MNVVKFRPLGRSGPVIKVRVTQKKRGFHSFSVKGKTRGVSMKQATRLMSNKRYVRVNQ